MTDAVDLLGKTFDQQLQVVGAAIADFDLTPNCRIPANITFEPIAKTQVRVSVYGEQGQLLFESKQRMAEDEPPPENTKGEIIFEPVSAGVRVTARDEHHKLLWGSVGSKAMVSQIHSSVAVYDTLQQLLDEELKRNGLPSLKAEPPMRSANQALDALQETLDNLRASITVKKLSVATEERAVAIARIAKDANKMINLETSSFKGNKGKR
jgi:hypothetical protein